LTFWAARPPSETYEDAMNNERENNGQESEILAETENLIAWRSRDESGFVYHLELGTLSLHLMPEEWEEFVILVENAAGH
jgi:hypothetical protein